jgi:acetate kinase
VHGGAEYSNPLIVKPSDILALERLIPLAPLHNPSNLMGIRICVNKFPSLPQIAVFDTAFHNTLPEHAFRYAVPEVWYRELGVR